MAVFIEKPRLIAWIRGVIECNDIDDRTRDEFRKLEKLVCDGFFDWQPND